MTKSSSTASWNYSTAFFCWIFFVHVTGIYFFTKGFLLTRIVLDEHSSCSELPGSVEFQASPVIAAQLTGCWHPRSFDKAVVIVIDALRYDFTIPSSNASAVPPQSFQNAFTCLHELAASEPHNAFLRPFIADPPTTTVQRLKGLTTGSLPTFIDAGSNFAGDAIEEDSLLYQLRAAGRRLVHLGDDTWTALFPGYFDPELSRPYESLVVEDLHSVDDGVIEHIFPLLAKPDSWDVIIAHFLGVDHAGHEHGPYHSAMRAKLQQMDRVIRDVVRAVDNDTLLIVMGDHGMDSSGNHGGESADEIQAALWMYSRKGIFGRTQKEHFQPPVDATIRPVDQIDLVPTLALLLGIPVPFNSLGSPIEEAFVGRDGTSLQNMAQVSRLAALGVERYQAVYSKSTGKRPDSDTSTEAAQNMWDLAVDHDTPENWSAAHAAFKTYQKETLSIYKGLWATFDLVSMAKGILISTLGVIILCFFAKALLEEATKAQCASSDFTAILEGVLIGSSVGLICSLGARIAGIVSDDLIDSSLFQIATGGIIGALTYVRKSFGRLPPTVNSIWSWLGAITVLSQSIGFASNSYTIWEDSILLFFLSSFAITTAAYSLRQNDKAARFQGVYESTLFALLGRIVFYSQRCREEQMPACQTTYFGATGSMAIFQNTIPFSIAVFLPLVVRAYCSSYNFRTGATKAWFSWGLHLGLLLNASHWFLRSADHGDWFVAFSKDTLKAVRVRISQITLALGFSMGVSAFIWPSGTTPVSQVRDRHVRSLRFSISVTATRYICLLTAFFLPAVLVQEPLGAGSLCLLLCQAFSLIEVLHTNSLQNHFIGPVMFGVLGSFHFFRTGHQATLSSIQWWSAYIASHKLHYPWSPLLVMLNTFGAQILVAIAVPLLTLWRSGEEPGEAWIVRSVSGTIGAHLLYHAMINLSTMMWAGLLRRHLMLYRVFCPRFMMGAVVLLIVDVVSIAVSLNGARSSLSSSSIANARS